MTSSSKVNCFFPLSLLFPDQWATKVIPAPFGFSDSQINVGAVVEPFKTYSDKKKKSILINLVNKP